MALVEREQHGRVAVLHLNRPQRRNALSGELVDALRDALEAVERDAEVGCVVLTGRGKAFCAGGDLAGGMSGAGQGVVAAHRARGGYGELLVQLHRLRVPVVAAINGDALGGGLGLAAACDLAVADETARLGTPEIRLGLFPWVITAVLQRNVSRKALMELMFLGEKQTAERAEALGLVNRVVPEGTAVSVALELAESIASRSPIATEMGKAAYHAVADLGLEDAVRFLNTQLTLNLMTEDAMEGVAAFLQKREPKWKGR